LTSANSQSGRLTLLCSNPAFSMSVLQKLDNVAPQIGAGKSALQVGDDLAHPRCAVNALQDLARAPGQLDHSFRIQQHVHLLRRLPLEAVMVSALEYCVIVQRHLRSTLARGADAVG